MSQLVAMFCDIDDFCKRFEPLYQPASPTTKVSVNACVRGQLSPQRNHDDHGPPAPVPLATRDFKHYYTDYVEAPHLRPYFPSPGELRPLCRADAPRPGTAVRLSAYAQRPLYRHHLCRFHAVGGVPQQADQSSPASLRGMPPEGNSSMGWYFGFKLPLMVNDSGELLAFRVTNRVKSMTASRSKQMT